MTIERLIRIISCPGIFIVLIALIACAPSVTTDPKSLSYSSKVEKVGNVPNSDGWQRLQFVDEREGWLTDGKNLWRTDDGGINWKLAHSVAANGRKIEDFNFANSQSGWMLEGGKLHTTEDGGLTWTELPTPLDFSKGDLRAVKFTDGGKVGWVAGGVYRPVSREELRRESYPNNVVSTLPDNSFAVLEGAIFRTDDSGETWQQQSIPTGSYRVLDLYFLNAEKGLALGDTGVFFTENRGNRWEAADFKDDCVNGKFIETFEGHPVSAYFLNSEVGWLSYTDGYVAKSEDGGRSWCDLLRPGTVWSEISYNTFFQDLHFTDPTHGRGLSADGSLYQTEDGGVTWTKADVNVQFEEIYFLNAGNGWAVAKEGLFRIVGP